MQPSHPIDRLDVASFAADGARLEGRCPLAGLPRLAADEWPGDAALTDELVWSARGERRAVAGAEPELWLHLQAHTLVRRECQRCLQQVALPVAVDRRLRFVRGEARAAQLDGELDDDVLELPPALDLLALIEDEVLLEVPFVARHDVCPEPLAMHAAGDDNAAAEAPPHPFAGLAALKRRPS